jgi:hypothetical protein
MLIVIDMLGDEDVVVINDHKNDSDYECEKEAFREELLYREPQLQVVINTIE